MEQVQELNENKLHELAGQMVNDLGASVNGALVVIGDKLGLYKAIKKAGQVTSTELAKQTNTAERYVREWLAAQAASKYLTYHPEAQSFSLSPEQAMIFANEDSPVLMTGGFYAVASVYSDESKITEAFKTGEGVSWGDHHTCLFCGVEKFFKPSYQSMLVQSWIPSLEGVEEKLKKGIRVADIGCGHAASTIIMAQAYPNSQFIGIDIHEPSILHARKHAQEAGLSNITFITKDASKYEGQQFDFITTFDCLHDMGDPAAISGQIKNLLSDDGTWMIVEPFANDNLQDNLNPVGRTYYGFSTTICVPSSLSQPGGKALGACAGETMVKREVTEGGFTSFRRATETPFNLIYEARK